LLKRPDAWQSATKQVVDFEANLESYLRNTNKEELNPEAIKRDLYSSMIHAQVGNRRSPSSLTVPALWHFCQREDITEEEANQIADQIESYRNSIVEQLQKVQQSITSAIDGILTTFATTSTR